MPLSNNLFSYSILLQSSPTELHTKLFVTPLHSKIYVKLRLKQQTHVLSSIWVSQMMIKLSEKCQTGDES